MDFTQAERRIAIDTPLGTDKLLLTAIDGVESLSTLFSYRLSLLSTDDAIDPAKIVGQNVTISLFDPDDEPHYINGYVRQFVHLGRGDRAAMYSAEVVPWLWFLTRRTDCRIFQDKTTPQIVEEVFSTLGLNDFDTSGLSGSYDKHEYCVQYRESDYNFVARLLEHEGIFYYFRHEADKHVLVLGDSTAAYKPAKEDKARFAGPQSFAEVDDNLTGWQHLYEYRSGKVALQDFNFEKPQDPVRAKERSLLKLANIDAFELYDYPGSFLEPDVGAKIARKRMEAEEAAYNRVAGSSKCRSFSPGRTFTIDAHHLQSEVGKRYVIMSVRHQADVGGYVPGAAAPEGYSNEFECMPADVVFRPQQVTPKGIVRGPQTAVVVGPSGEEIYCDKHGRVKVQFYWDRYGKFDDKSSCWIRVSHAWAGQGYGAVSVPRIGQEVIVDFLEGDPDRPIITGRVYNADQATPAKLPEPTAPTKDGSKPIPAMQGRDGELPAAKTRTSIKSNSTPGGGSGNEISFDDKAGKELFFVNASKDAVTTVANNSVTSVGADSQLSVGNNLTEFVGANRDRTVGAKEDVTIGSNQTVTVGAKQDISVSSNRSVTVGGNQSHSVKGNNEETIGGNHTLGVKGNGEITIAGNLSLSVGGKLDRTAGAVSDSYKSQQSSVTAAYELQAAQVKITGMAEITLAVGGSFVKIDPSGVTIFGPLVKIN